MTIIFVYKLATFHYAMKCTIVIGLDDNLVIVKTHLSDFRIDKSFQVLLPQVQNFKGGLEFRSTFNFISLAVLGAKATSEL